jgi:inner membrane protein involved in colicin E2 resistance
METPPTLVPRSKYDRRNAVTLKLLFIAALVLLLHVPLHLVNALRQERTQNLEQAVQRVAARTPEAPARSARSAATFEGYRMVERSLKHGVLVLSLVFAAFFLFETLAGLRLHAIHYSLVGAALCLFYLALLAMGEVITPGSAYVVAATASSLLITLYSASILRGWARASLIAGLLAIVHSVLFVVLRMEDFALLAGTAALFAALAAVMFFTRNVDWHAQDVGAVTAK